MPPEARFQHTALFHGAEMVVIGGRGSDVAKALPTVVYDTETCEWRGLPSVNRFRHSCWGTGLSLFTYGGFDHKCPTAPTNDLQAVDVGKGSTVPHNDSGKPGKGDPMPPAVEEFDEAPRMSFTSNELHDTAMKVPPTSQYPAGAQANEPGVKIASQVFVSLEKDYTHHVRKVGIETLEDEGRKMHPSKILAGVQQNADIDSGVATWAVEMLLQPTTWQPSGDESFVLQRRDVAQLCDQMLHVVSKEPAVLRVRAPIKVYGDIHGQFLDLMRLFARYKSPSEQEGGDIDTMDYLFLGDYVDRGNWSLEVICLLFALKIKYPSQIHMIRGNHEDATINAIYGFREECRRRLQEDPDEAGSCWERANRVFEMLPLGAVIENQILCLHGGIGGAIKKISDIENMQRPLHVAQVPQNDAEQMVTDLLWSDPTDADHIGGVTQNETRDPEGTGRIVKFGPDRVEEFMAANPPIKMVIRAHECVMDGFERFADGRVITVFSATDYCGHHKNAGALLFIRRDLTVVPKLIYPMDRTMSTWDAMVTNQRPPTPPRPVPRGRRE
jgi:protein phosphatase